MFNPLDMLQAQGGAGLQSVAQQFGLTPEQTRSAMAALMPAFALGMQRSAAPDPTGLSQLFGMAQGRPPASPAETMLGQLFGSPALTQAILQQASSASGVGSQVLRQMLPAMAGAVVASIVHMLLNQQAPEPARAAPAPAPFAPAWAEMMKAFLPVEAPAKAAETPRPQASARPQPSRPQASARPQPAAPEPAKPDATAPGSGMLQQMLKTGAEVQEQNVRAMQGLFEAFWTDTDRGRDKPKEGIAAADGVGEAETPGTAAPAPVDPPQPEPEAPARSRRARPPAR